MANLFETFRNNVINGIRVKPNKSKKNDSTINVDDDLVEFLRSLDSDQILDIVGINNFREISDNRGEQYDAFDEMEKDATISAALKMYADDATQYDLNGNVIWVESDDPNIAAFGNRLLQVLRINEKAWTHIYNLVKYGDLYLETFYDDEVDADSLISTPVRGTYGTVAQSHKIGARLDEYVEMVHNPAVIFDLRKRGKTEGYIKLDDADENSNIQRVYSISLAGTQQRVLPADKYIHIMLSEESNRFPETFDITFEETENRNIENNERDIRTYRYTVAKGKSILHDAFKAFRELKLMEDSILLNRVTRSAITRILQIEVGDMPKPQVKEKLRQIKMMIEQKNFMDQGRGEFANQASPGPIDNIIYVPTRNGNGSITTDTLGGDVDPKSLIDIEYYQQKLAGALGIVLAYLRGQCFRYDTKIRLLDNTVVSIGDMYNNREYYIGKSLLSCYSDGTIHPTLISDIRKTRKNASYVRVTLDNGEFVDVTPDHRMMLRDGSFIEAAFLSPGDSLMPCYRRECPWNDYQYNGRIQVYDNKNSGWKFQYHIVGTYLNGYKNGMSIHHKDTNIKNDSLENLELLSAADHLRCHHNLAKTLSPEAAKKYFYSRGNASNKYFSTNYMKQLVNEKLVNSDPVIVNHKVLSVEFLDVCEDAYDITVKSDAHTFALDCGIFVHNSGDGGGLSSGTALTKLDNKYARTIKRIQNAYMQGITTLINVFAIRKNLVDYVNAFKVRMVSPSTIEDDDRDQQFDNRINMTSSLVGIINDADVLTDEGKAELVKYMTSSFLNKPEITKILEEFEKEHDKEELEPEVEGDTGGGSGSGGVDLTSGGGDTDFDMGGLESVSLDGVPPAGGEEETASGDEEVSITPGEDVGFGDFEEFAD